MTPKPTEPIDDELLQKLENIQYKFGCGNIANKKIVSLITADRKQLLDRVEKEVIGEDVGVTADDFDVSAYFKTAKNDLRAEERTALAKLRKDLGL